MGSLAESNTTCPLTIVHVDREGSNCLLEKRHCNIYLSGNLSNVSLNLRFSITQM